MAGSGVEQHYEKPIVEGSSEVKSVPVLTGAAKAAHEKAVAKKAREAEEARKALEADDDEPPFRFPKPDYNGPMIPYPFSDGGVNENATIRMVKMVAAICPSDPRPTILGRDGIERVNPRYNGDPNCQQTYKINNQGRWRIDICEGLGHNPWYTTFRRSVVQDVIDPEGWVLEEKTRVKVEEKLNVIQVSDNPRHSSRMEIALAIARGARFLHEFGILAPCEFRNCTKPVEIETRFGNYCSERHARLVAADFKKILLPIGGDPFVEEETAEAREELLEGIQIGKKS